MDLNEIIGKNIQNLRKSKNMTQKDLADVFNYTPKAVSKWERGEAVPEINTLKAISSYFGVTVDCLLQENGYLSKKDYRSTDSKKELNLIQSLLIISVIWTIAAIAFVYLLQHNTIQKSWICFIWAIPISTLPPIYFYRKEPHPILNFILYSICMWSTLLSIYLSLYHLQIYLIFLIGIPAQVSILFVSKIMAKK